MTHNRKNTKMKSLDKLTAEQKKFVNEYVALNGGDECCLELLVESFEEVWSGSFTTYSIGDEFFGYSEDDGIWLLEQVLVQ